MIYFISFICFCLGYALGFRSGCVFTAKEFYEYINKKTYKEYKNPKRS